MYVFLNVHILEALLKEYGYHYSVFIYKTIYVPFKANTCPLKENMETVKV